jgi:hypothetical protein
LTTIPLRSIAADELGSYFKNEEDFFKEALKYKVITRLRLLWLRRDLLEAIS